MRKMFVCHLSRIEPKGMRKSAVSHPLLCPGGQLLFDFLEGLELHAMGSADFETMKPSRKSNSSIVLTGPLLHGCWVIFLFTETVV